MSKTNVAQVVNNIRQRVRRIVGVEIDKFLRGPVYKEIKRRLTAGTGPDTLAKRCGALVRSIKPYPTRLKGDTYEGGIKHVPQVNARGVSTLKYINVHFGPKGKKTTMWPTKAGRLTVPLPNALGSNGMAKGSARSPVWGPTTRVNSIIYGNPGYGAGLGNRRGNAAGWIPLFVLKEKVTVPARIDLQNDVAVPMMPVLAYLIGSKIGKMK